LILKALSKFNNGKVNVQTIGLTLKDDFHGPPADMSGWPQE
jgi:hypothetical protein